MQATDNPQARSALELPDLPEYKGYRILKSLVLYGEIGSGDCGTMYRGRFLNLGIDVAVRHLNPKFMRVARDFAAQFMSRFKEAAVPTHTGFVNVYECLEHAEHLFVVSDYADGESCFERVRRKRSLPFEEAKRIGLEIARAISAAHSWGVIHGNLHPANVLIAASGDIKITDLGLYPILRSILGYSGSLLLPIRSEYRPPEDAPDRGADVFAVGATLYFLLTGRHPIASDPLSEEPPAPDAPPRPPTDRFPELKKLSAGPAAPLATVIERATSREPAERYANATELLHELEKACGPCDFSLKDPEAGTCSPQRFRYKTPQVETLSEIREFLVEAQQSSTPAQDPIPFALPLNKKRLRALNLFLLLIVLVLVALAGFVFLVPQGEPWKEKTLEQWRHLKEQGWSLLDRLKPRRPVAAPPELSVNFPEDGAILPPGTVTVFGRIQSSSQASVLVNAVQAVTTGAQWSADVPIRKETTTIQVVAVDAAGLRNEVIRRVECGRSVSWARAKMGTACDPHFKLPQEVIHEDSGIELVFIPPGTYDRGAVPTDVEAQKDELPRHTVTIEKPFYLGRYEVTNAQFRRFRASHRGGSTRGLTLDDDRMPVTMVPWNDAVAYCEKHGFRLPTEAEWEYACRAGTQTRYPWGDEAADGAGFANVFDKSGARLGYSWDSFSFDDGAAVASPVGRYRANPFGLQDMVGNVWEWCADVYDVNAYQTFASGSVAGAAKVRVLRGGSWYDRPRNCRISTRNGGDASLRTSFVGFRVAHDP